MLRITVPATEQFDEERLEFINTEEQTLVLEHSLVSLSKWESKWKKAFLGHREKTREEIMDYVRCMTITPNVNPDVYSALTEDNIKAINEYISDEMTAVKFPEEKQGGGVRDTVTSEVIYYWMITLNIPFECQKWHLNRLLSLIRVCNMKNGPQKKMSKSEILSRNAALNAARRKKYNSRG